jgi:hypothetical protein
MACIFPPLHDANTEVNMAFDSLKSHVVPSKFGGLSLRHVLALQQPRFLHPSPSTSQQVIPIFIQPLKGLLDPASESYRLDAANTFDLLFSFLAISVLEMEWLRERPLRHVCQIPTDGPRKRRVADGKDPCRPRYFQIGLT